MVTTARGPERVIAVDIFRERVFLRSEEHGSRIIPLVQLREEVEALGEVLLTAESRSQLAQATEAAAEPDLPAADLAASQAALPAGQAAKPSGRPPRRRRRRHRGGGAGGSGQGEGPG